MNEYVVESPADEVVTPVDPRRALLLPLWRGRHLILGAALLGVLGGGFAGVIRPNTYRSIGKLMIRAGAREELTPEMSVTGSGGGYGMGRNVVNDEMHLLSAVRVYEETVRIVTPAEVFRAYDPRVLDGEETPALLALFHRGQAWWFRSAPGTGDLPNHEIDGCDQCVRLAATFVSRSLVLDPSPGSDVITVSYTAHDPQVAQKVVAAFIEAAVAQHRRVYDTSPALEFLGAQLDDALKDLTSIENQFTNYKTECGVFDFETQQRTVSTDIQTLEAQTSRDQSHLEELRAGTADMKAKVASLPETLEEPTEHNLQANPARSVLLAHILGLENNLTTLDRTPGGTTRDREIQRENISQLIETTRKDLDKLPEFVDAGPSVRRVSNPRRDRLLQNLDDATRELVALEAAAAVRTGQLRDARERQQAIVRCEPQFNSFAATTSLARRRYEGVRTQHERATLMGSMDQLEMSNLRRIEEATLPIEKDGPLRGKLLMLGLLLGGAAGCGLAFARNLFDHRLHDAIELEQLLGTTVLAEISQIGSPSKGQRGARPVAP